MAAFHLHLPISSFSSLGFWRYLLNVSESAFKWSAKEVTPIAATILRYKHWRLLQLSHGKSRFNRGEGVPLAFVRWVEECRFCFNHPRYLLPSGT